jgi:hypothetical protein
MNPLTPYWNNPEQQPKQPKSEAECLRSIDQSLTTISRLLATVRYIAIWFLALSILGLMFGFIAVIIGAFR